MLFSYVALRDYCLIAETRNKGTIANPIQYGDPCFDLQKSPLEQHPVRTFLASSEI